ncbi:MAG: PLP-dependent aminotransferase family protein [Acidimicrobiales bacterium]
MRDLVLQLDRSLGRRVGVERALRQAIRDGQLTPGSQLPSSRALAEDLGLARATIVAAFEQLTVEGYLVSRHGVGTIVSEVPSTALEAPLEEGLGPTMAADFRPGEPDASLFPRAAWLRSVRRVVNGSPDSLLGYGHPTGLSSLRTALGTYLGRSRAVFADPAAISIFGGSTSAVGFLGEMFQTLGITRVAVEDPTLPFLRDVWKLVGITPLPVPIDDEGIDVEALDRLGVHAVVVTPSHQYPLGVTMSATRRAEIIGWARSRDGWIIEDDYDGEFRYDRQPIGALQGLDPERVIYMGTASKSLSPSLRISWLVVPRELASPLARVKHLRAGVSTIDQGALADFIDRGELDRHVRHVRSVYQQRQIELVQRLRSDVQWLSVPDIQAGLHLTATFDEATTKISECELVQRARELSIGLFGLSEHYLRSAPDCGLVLGYTRPPQHGYAEALDRLLNFLKSAQ